MKHSHITRAASARSRLTEGEREFHRERVALLGKVGATIGGFAVLVQVSLAYAVPGYAQPWGMGTWLLVGGALAPGAAWLVSARGDVGASVVEAAEAGAVLSSSIAYSAILLELNVQHHFERLLLLALAMIAMLRAVIVPASPQRTAAITAAMAVPLSIATALAYRHYVPTPGDALSLTHTPATMTAWSLVWWSVVIVLCTFTSRVIFGLRSEIRAAKQIGQYVLEEKIGQGGMGEVYRARHALLKRPTAIKLVPPEAAAASALARFEREAQLTARLTHANTITIFDYGRTPQGVLYYAMDLLEGATLEDVVRVSGPQAPGRVAHVARCVLGSLAEAHDHGLIHRDIKATNVMLCTRGRVQDFVKVLDFGLARLVAEADDNDMLGTPLYLSPESITEPESVDGRHDLYGLGVLAYYLLTGRHPFVGDTVEEVCRAHLRGAPDPFEHHVTTTMPAGLEAWVMGLLAHDVAGRPVDAAAALDTLDRLELPEWGAHEARGWWDAFGPYVEQRQAAQRVVADERALES